MPVYTLVPEILGHRLVGENNGVVVLPRKKLFICFLNTICQVALELHWDSCTP